MPSVLFICRQGTTILGPLIHGPEYEAESVELLRALDRPLVLYLLGSLNPKFPQNCILIPNLQSPYVILQLISAMECQFW
jgi:hypothetical protein